MSAGEPPELPELGEMLEPGELQQPVLFSVLVYLRQSYLYMPKKACVIQTDLIFYEPSQPPEPLGPSEPGEVRQSESCKIWESERMEPLELQEQRNRGVRAYCHVCH